MASGSWKRQRNRKEIDSPFEPPKRHTALLILDFSPVRLTLDFWPLDCKRIKVCVFKSLSVLNKLVNLLIKQQEETNTLIRGQIYQCREWQEGEDQGFPGLPRRRRTLAPWGRCRWGENIVCILCVKAPSTGGVRHRLGSEGSQGACSQSVRRKRCKHSLRNFRQSWIVWAFVNWVRDLSS